MKKKQKEIPEKQGKKQSIASIIMSTLKKENITHIFGMHGGYTVGIGEEINNHPEIQFIRCQHEGGAAFMADGYAKASGRFGVLLTTAGPGLSNAFTGIISSMTDNTPILHLCGAVPREKTRIGAIQDTEAYGLDIPTSIKDAVSFYANIYRKQTFLSNFRLALRHLFNGKKGPVFLNIASDVFSQKLESNYKYLKHSSNRVFDQQGCYFTLDELQNSKNAIIIAGNGVKQSCAEEELNELAEMLQIPVIVTPKGKSVFNNESPLFLGSIGAASNTIPIEFLKNEKIDTVLAIGTSFNEYSSNSWTSGIGNINTIIQFDVDPYVIGRAYSDSFGVLGDIKANLNYLNRKIRKDLNDYKHLNYKNSITSYRQKHDNITKKERFHSNNLPLKAERLVNDVQQAFFNFDVNFYNDNGSCIFYLNHYLQLRKDWKFFSSLGFSSMGYAFPAAIGGALAEPERIHIAFAGDGAAIMNGNELKTASEYNVPVFFIVLNDGRLGIVHHSTKILYERPNPGTTFNEKIDFVKFAESLGVEAYKIDKPKQINENFVKNLVNKQKPILFDCHIDPDSVGPYGDRIAQVKK